MSGIFRVEYADIARSTGFPVVEHQGWRTRARSNNTGGYADAARPWCCMWHHTASPPSWNGQKDADYIAFGDSDAPLANFYIDRSGTIWVIAAGCTNTNGKGTAMKFSKGTVPNDSMNSYACGIECGNNGVGEAWPQRQIDALFALSNAVNAAFGNQPTDIAGHAHWTTRKIDPATAAAVQGPWCPRSINSSGTWNLQDMRDECSRRRAGPPPSKEDMMLVEVAVNGAKARFLGHRVDQNGKQFILWMEWVNGADPQQMNRLTSYRNLGVPLHTIANIHDLQGVGLLGPVPTGDSDHNWSAHDFGNVM